MLGCEGPPTCKRWKHPSTPQNTTTQNITAILKIMLLAQEAKQSITKLQYIVKETYLTLIWWFAWFWQPKSQKSPRRDLHHSDVKSTKQDWWWPAYRILTCVFLLHFSFVRLNVKVCKHLKLWYACWWMSMSHSHHKTKLRDSLQLYITAKIWHIS